MFEALISFVKKTQGGVCRALVPIDVLCRRAGIIKTNRASLENVNERSLT